MDLDDSHFFLHSALFDYHLFRLFLGGDGPDCWAGPSADNRAAGATYLGAYACTNATTERSADNRTLVHLACRCGARDPKSKQRDC